MLLTLFTPIGSPFLRAHVTGTDDDGGCRVGFVHKKHHDIASAEGLAESSIDIVVFNMPFLSKADTRLTEQNLASFSDSHAVLRGDFVGNIVRTNDVVNAHGISITRSLSSIGWLMLSYVSTAFSIVSCWLTPNYSAESRTKYYTKGDHGFWHSYAFTAGNFHEPIQLQA